MLSRGLISGHWSKARSGERDFRAVAPRFQGANLDRNLAGSHARGVQRDDLDLNAHDLSLSRLLEHRVERVRLGPAIYPRVELVRNGSRRVDGSFGTVRIDARV